MKLGHLLAALLAVTTCPAQAAPDEDFRCLVGSGKPAMALEFRQFGDARVNWSGGYVLYRGSKQAIPIVFVRNKVLDQPPGRPWEFEDTWVEIVGGKVNGSYTVSHQGANITAFTYRAAKDGREFSFDQDIEHVGTHDCQW